MRRTSLLFVFALLTPSTLAFAQATSEPATGGPSFDASLAEALENAAKKTTETVNRR